MANEPTNVGPQGLDVWMRFAPAGAGGPGAGAGPRCTIQFSSETLSVDPTNKTVQQLFLENADALGFDRNRAVAYRRNQQTIDPSTPAAAGQTYVASIAYEQKGL
jgi:hypothetical protein